MSVNPFSAVFKDIKPNNNIIKAFYPYPGLSEEQEAKIRPEIQMISQRIRDANAKGLRKFRLEPHPKPSYQTVNILAEYAGITPIYWGNSPETDEPVFRGWDIVW